MFKKILDLLKSEPAAEQQKKSESQEKQEKIAAAIHKTRTKTYEIMGAVNLIAKRYNLTSREIEKRLTDITPMVNGLFPPIAQYAIDYGAIPPGETRPARLKGKKLHVRWIPYMLLLSQGNSIRENANDIQKHYLLRHAFSILTQHYQSDKNKLTEKDYAYLEELLKSIYNELYADEEIKEKTKELVEKDMRAHLNADHIRDSETIINSYIDTAKQNQYSYYYPSIKKIYEHGYLPYIKETKNFLSTLTPAQQTQFNDYMQKTVANHTERVRKTTQKTITTFLKRDENDILENLKSNPPGTLYSVKNIGAKNKVQKSILEYIIILDLKYQLLEVLKQRNVVNDEKANSILVSYFGTIFGFLRQSINTFKTKHMVSEK